MQEWSQNLIKEILRIFTEIPSISLAFPRGIDFISFSRKHCDIFGILKFDPRGARQGIEILGFEWFIF